MGCYVTVDQLVKEANTAEYTRVDEYMNCIKVQLSERPIIVSRCYIIKNNAK